MIERLSQEPDENECEPCAICGGTGEIVTPAHQEAGRIIEERIDPCICQKRDDE